LRKENEQLRIDNIHL